MEEKKVEEMLREEVPVTEEASGDTGAGTAEAAADAADEKAAAEEEEAAAGQTDAAAAQENGDGEEAGPEAADSEDGDCGEAAEGEGSDGNSQGNSDGTDLAGGKKGFFSKFKKGDKEKAALQEKVDVLEDRVKRQMAEFDNFRKRTEKEKQQMFSMGERNVIEKMLPVVDNFERGLAAVPEGEKDSPIASGMEMVYRQLMKQLEDLGVAPIEAVGQEFDPNFHNAVMQVESEEYPSGTVAQEFQKGYKYRDAVVRHSMVGVAQ